MQAGEAFALWEATLALGVAKMDKMLLSGHACFVLAWSKVKCQEVGFG